MVVVECRGGGERVGLRREANKGLGHVGVNLEGGILCSVCSPCSLLDWIQKGSLICSNELTNFSYLAFD